MMHPDHTIQQTRYYRRFVTLLLASLVFCIGFLFFGAEAFHRYILVPNYEPRRLQLDNYLAHSDKNYIAFGSSQTNMSLNIDDPQFYNLAWRAEAMAEQWLKLRIILRTAAHKPCRVFLETNSTLMVHTGTENPIFYYRDYITPDDLEIFKESGIQYQYPLFSHLDGPYRKELSKLITKYIKSGTLKPDPDINHFDILPNGYSYNILPNKNFTGHLDSRPYPPDINKNFDHFFRLFIEEAQKNGIEVVLISTPYHKSQRQIMNENTETIKNIKLYITHTQEKYGLKYYDFSDFSDEMDNFWNEDHMSLAGAKKFGIYAKKQLMNPACQ